MQALLYIGNSDGTLKAAADAVVAVVKAAGTEAAIVAACNCLAELARAPNAVTVSGCTLTNNTGARRKTR